MQGHTSWWWASIGAPMGGGAGPAHYWLLFHPATVRSGGGLFLIHLPLCPLPQENSDLWFPFKEVSSTALNWAQLIFFFLVFYLKCLGHQIIYPSIPYSVFMINRNVKPLAGLMVENWGGVINIKKHLFCSPPKLSGYLFILILGCLPYLLWTSGA